MRGLSAATLLNLWERGREKRPVQRALELLAAACPDETREALALRSIGQRDAILLDLREATLGPEMQSVLKCTDCNQRVELTFSTSDIRPRHVHESQPEVELEVGEYQLRLRRPNSVDMVAVAENCASHATHDLFYRCLIGAHCSGRLITELPSEIIQAAGEKMADMDSSANVELLVSCPSCGNRRTVVFDIASFFWAEIEAFAARLLGDVHELASAYGWTEPDILALSGPRRQFYLEAVRA